MRISDWSSDLCSSDLYHALIKCDDPQRIARSRLEIASTWIAAGLDTDKVTFYRQSDIPEIPELCWMLTCVTAKGLMNRAHAYKAAVDQNVAKRRSEEHTSELQSLMRISYAVFCLKKKNKKIKTSHQNSTTIKMNTHNNI